MQVRSSAALLVSSVFVLAACGSSSSDASASASAAALASAKNGKVLEADENQSQAVTESTAKAA
ncbi:MAG TPA: hypothetical protein VL400_13885, partial [Polyangiaceae bacterium]|nr:hypothetical protein [Polyangiaceae bacterium]